MTAAVYRVEHETSYVHSGRVSTSQHVACLTPRTLPSQTVRSHELVVEPAPASHVQRIDYFGNAVDQFTILTPYKEMRVVGRSVVEVMGSALSAAVMARLDAGAGADAACRRRWRRAFREQRTLGNGARRAHLPARVAVRRYGRAQLSLAVHRHEPRTCGVCPRVVCERSSAGRGGRGLDAPDQPGIHLRFRSDDHRDAGDAGDDQSPRGLPGLCAFAGRVPEVAGAARALRQRLPRDPPGARPAAAGRRRRVARLAVGLVSAARMGRSRSHQRRAAFSTPRDSSPGAATTATSARFAASCLAAATTR